MSVNQNLGPVHMSLVMGTNFAWVHLTNLSPVSKRRKGQRSRGWVLMLNSKQSKHGKTQKFLTFGSIIASATLKAVSLQLNEMLMMWKIWQAMQDNTIWSVHMAKFPAHLPRSRKPSQTTLSYEHIKNFTKDSEVRQDFRNRAHVKRPLVYCQSTVGKLSTNIAYWSTVARQFFAIFTISLWQGNCKEQLP